MDNKPERDEGSELRQLKGAADVRVGDSEMLDTVSSASMNTSATISSRHQQGHKKLIALSISLIVIAATVAGIVAATNQPDSAGVANKSQLADKFDAQDIILSENALSPGVSSLATTQSLSVNGQLRVNNSFVIGPSSRPTAGSAGQVYFDKDTNQIMYYNGQRFTAVAASDQVGTLQNQLSTASSAIAVLQSAEAPSLPLDIARQGGSNTFTTQNNFAAGLSSSQVRVAGSTVTGSLRVNADTTVGNNLTVAGDTVLGATTMSSLLLNSPLGVASGGTGLSSITANGVIVGNGVNPVSTVTASASNLCLMSTSTGAPEFKTCPGGGGSGIEAINGIDGNLTLANSSGLGTTITIDDASTTAKGIASFNANNFSVSSGTVNTIQNIGVMSAPTFAGLTVSGTVAATNFTGNGASVTNINAGNISSGTLSDSRLSSNIPLKNAAVNFTGSLQQGGNDVCTAANNCGYLTGSAANGSYVQLQATTGTAQTGHLNISGTAVASSFSGNGAGVTNVNAIQLGGQGAAYYLNASNLTGTLADARLSSNVTLQGNSFNSANRLVQLNSSTQLPAVSGTLLTNLNASAISTGTIGDGRLSSNVALKDAAIANFTGSLQQNGNAVCTTAGNCVGSGSGGAVGGSGTVGTIAVFNGSGYTLANSLLSQSSNTLTTAGNLLNATGALTVSAGGANQNLTLQGSGTGRVVVQNPSFKNANGATYQFSAADANAVTATICTTAGNCTGANGGGVISGGTSGNLAVYGTDGYHLENSIISQDGTLLSVAGSLSATALQGDGADITDLSATNISTGTLADVRLSSNVALKNASTVNFTGALQRAGNTVCDNSNNCGYLTGSAADGNYVQLQPTASGVAQTGNLKINGSAIANTFVGDGAGVTNVNAAQFNSQNASYYLDAGNLTGSLADARLSSNVALKNGATVNFTGTLQQNGNAVCTTAGNCVGSGSGGALGGSGTTGTIAIFSGSGYTLADSLLSQEDSMVTVDGDLAATNLSGNGAGVTNVNAAQLNGQVASYYLNAGNLTGNLADARLSGNVALKDTATNFTGTLQQGGSNVCTAANNCGYLTGSAANGSYVQLQATTGTAQTGYLNINGTATATSFSGNGANITSVNAAQLNNQSAAYYLNAGNLTGTLADARLSSNVALKNVTANFTGALQQGGADVCTTAGNCVGSGGGGALGGSGTAGTVAVFSGSGYTLADSLIAQEDDLVTVDGNLVALSFSGNGTNITNVNAAQFNSQNAAYYLNAGNLTGNLADARLSSNVALLNATQSFTGAVSFTAANTALQVTNNATIGGTLAVSGALSGASLSTGASGIAVNNGTSATTVLSGASGAVTLQNVNIVPNGSVTAGSGMGVLFTDATGKIQKVGVSGQDGNCVGYNGTSIVFQGCSGSGGGITTEFANGGNSFTGGNGTTATTRIATSYDAAITNPVLGLSSNAALDVITNNVSRINIQAGGDVSVLSNSGSSTSKFAVRTVNTGDPARYINTLVVDTSTTGDTGGKVGIGLTVGTAPQVTLDIGGGLNNGGGSGLQVRASGAPGLSVSGSGGAGTSSTGRIYFDQTDRKFKVSENGGAYVDLVQGGGAAATFINGGNNFNANAILGTKDSFALSVITNNAERMSIDNSGNIAFKTNQYVDFYNASGNTSLLRIDRNGSSVLVNTTSAQGGTALNVGGNINASGYKINGTTGHSLTCGSGAQALGAFTFVGGILTGGQCSQNNSDLAEAYNSTDSLQPGELVMSAGTAATSVSRATAPGEGALMGVVSTAPAQTIGTAQVPNGYPIALSGRVPTKVNGEGGAIAVGDKITISSVSGVGKKATSAGMIVGTAVEAFDGNGTGIVEVFVNLTYFEPSNTEILQSSAANFGDLNVSGTATIEELRVTNAVVSGNFTVNGLTAVQSIVVNGHIITSGGQPQVSAEVATGNGTVSIEGNDTAGSITVVTGGAPSAGELVKLVFSQAYAKAPRMVISASNEAASSLGVYKNDATANGVFINTTQVPSPNTTYMFDYFIVE